MAVAYESISSTTYGSRTDTTVTAPTGIQAGNLLLAWMAKVHGSSLDDAPTPPTGFATVPGTWPLEPSGPAIFMDCWLYYKVADSGDAVAVDFTFTHAARSTQVVMIRVSGQDTGTPFNVTPSQTIGTDVTATWTGVTTTVDGCLVILFGSDWAQNTNDLAPPSGSTPTFTERLDILLTYVATGTLATAGATGDKTHASNATGAGAWASVLVALAPAGGGAPVDPARAPVLTFRPAVIRPNGWW